MTHSGRHERPASGSKRKIAEEEIEEYLAKKAHKRATKVAKKLNLQSVSGYSNDSNPFGDSNLNEKFVWRKKIQRDISRGVPLNEFSIKTEKKKMRERMSEIEKVKKRREERAIEKAQHEEKMALLARDRARSELQDWEKKEEEFHFVQSKIRSEIRLREGRPKPIDLLSKHLDHPSDVIKGLSVREMDELLSDIKMHLDLDRTAPAHVRYWEAVLVVSEWEFAEARKRDALERAGGEMVGEERGLHPSIEADVNSLLQVKISTELEAVQMQSEIESQMQFGTAKVVEYCEAVLRRIEIYKANACLKEIHAIHSKQFLGASFVGDADKIEDTPDDALHDIQAQEDDKAAGSYSPKLLQSGDEDKDEDVIDPEEDSAVLERKKLCIEELARNEVNLDTQVYWWHDKYHPRKPKYFNRVHTGYEWNKYNQTHYDHDNPPPKFVQGYKFDIFYPDLVDKSKAPTYTIQRDEDSSETCIIRFHASPPYEDIAFRIVNKEWEYSRKNGFKCTFERGILHLYFNFKRYRYRK